MDSHENSSVDISLELFTPEEKEIVKAMYTAHNDYSLNKISTENHNTAIDNGQKVFQAMLRRIGAELDIKNTIKEMCGPDIYEQARKLIQEPISLEQFKIVTNVIASIKDHESNMKKK